MNIYALTAISFIISFLLYIPFIKLLYKLKLHDPFRDENRKDSFGQGTRIFDLLRKHKSGTPTGGGILTALLSITLFLMVCFTQSYEKSNYSIILIFSLLLFGFIGLYDDVRKILKITGQGLRVRVKLGIQLLSGMAISALFLSFDLFNLNIFEKFYINNGIVEFVIGTFIIVWMANAFNIIDGIDGLSSGLLMITLLPFWLIFYLIGNIHVSIFIAILFGVNLAYLYFNINPARLFMGDTGAIGLGAVLGVLLLFVGRLELFVVMFMLFHVDSTSSLLQWASKALRKGKRIFMIAPIHHHFEAIGWDSSKVVFRFWIIHIVFVLFSLAVFFS